MLYLDVKQWCLCCSKSPVCIWEPKIQKEILCILRRRVHSEEGAERNSVKVTLRDRSNELVCNEHVYAESGAHCGASGHVDPCCGASGHVDTWAEP